MATMAPWRRCAPARGGTPLAGVLVRTTVSHSRPDRGTRGTAWAPSRRWGGAVAESAPGAAARSEVGGISDEEHRPVQRRMVSAGSRYRLVGDIARRVPGRHAGTLTTAGTAWLVTRRRSSRDNGVGALPSRWLSHGRSYCVRRPTSWSLASKTRNASRATATSRITESASPRGRCVSGPARCGSSRRSSSGANSASRPGRAAWTTRSRS